MTAKELLDELTKMIEDYPPCAGFPCIYSIDDEGNAYHKVHNEPTLVQAEDIDAWFLEVVGFVDDETILKEDANCVIIN